MKTLRLARIVLVASMALFATLVAFGNLTDYGSNWAFVQHVLSMNDIFPNSTIRYRAITTTWLEAFSYWLIIAFECLTAILCWWGAIAMLRVINAPKKIFFRARSVAVVGLVTGFVLWQVGFMTIGGEWFGMWMSSHWNGIPSAFHFWVTILLVLIFLAMDEPAETD